MAKPEIIQDIINIETGATALANVELTGTAVLPYNTTIGDVQNWEINYLTGVVGSIQDQFDAKASLASPAFTGTPTAPTASVGTNTTQVATTSFVKSEIPNLLNAGGSAPLYACRAWVNFNGTGTVAIRSSGNVSSITDGGVGVYTINFTTAMPDANYCAVSVSMNGGVANSVVLSPEQYSANSLILQNRNFTPSNHDSPYCNVAIFR